MNWLSITGVAIGLAMDAFAVSIAVGLSLPKLTARHVFRVAWHFGLFQFMMPVLGWLAGRTVSGCIAAYDHWVAFALLAFIGGKMIYEALTEKPRPAGSDPTRGVTLVVLSVATSMDALAVGLSMAFMNVSVWLPSVVIGLVAGLLTVAGICFGRRLGSSWGRRAEFGGGIVLILIGARILAAALWAGN